MLFLLFVLVYFIGFWDIFSILSQEDHVKRYIRDLVESELEKIDDTDESIDTSQDQAQAQSTNSEPNLFQKVFDNILESELGEKDDSSVIALESPIKDLTIDNQPSDDSSTERRLISSTERLSSVDHSKECSTSKTSQHGDIPK